MAARLLHPAEVVRAKSAAFCLSRVARNLSDDQPADWARDDNAEVIAEYESSLTTEQLTVMRDAVRERMKGLRTMDANLFIELKLIWVARWLGWRRRRASEPQPAREPEAPRGAAQADRPRRSLAAIKLLRNTIFARKGRPFETPLVKGHFKTVVWYVANPKYTDKLLNNINKKNVKLIQSLEKQLKREAEANFMVAA